MASKSDEITDLEISFLLGQQVVVVLQSVASLDNIMVELEPGLNIEASMHNLEFAEEKNEDILKQWIGHYLIVYVDDVIEKR